MLRNTGLLVAALLLTPSWVRAEDAYTIKQIESSPPKEVSEPIRKLLEKNAIQLAAGQGGTLCTVWFRTEIPAKATPEQIKNGLTYRELEESTVLGAVRVDQPITDYRKQKIKPGVYTLRLGFQPMDGDHMGTAPYPDFCLLVPASADDKPDLIETKELRELSAKSAGSSHPGVLLLFPNEKPEDKPALVNKGSDTWVLNVKLPISVDGKKTGSIGLSLTLIGHTTAE